MTFREAGIPTLRAGLAADRDARRPSPYVQRTFGMGVRPGIELRKAGQLAAELEDEETVRKMLMGK